MRSVSKLVGCNESFCKINWAVVFIEPAADESGSINNSALEKEKKEYYENRQWKEKYQKEMY